MDNFRRHCRGGNLPPAGLRITLAKGCHCVYNVKHKLRKRSDGPLLFEWDDEKAAVNLKKHGVDFRDAVAVFDDEYRIEWFDAAHSDTTQTHGNHK